MADPQPQETRLTSAKAEEFRRLLREGCRLELSTAEAWRLARDLISLYRTLMGPIPEDPSVQTSSKPVDNSPVLE